jgi:hypothetical protein
MPIEKNLNCIFTLEDIEPDDAFTLINDNRNFHTFTARQLALYAKKTHFQDVHNWLNGENMSQVTINNLNAGTAITDWLSDAPTNPKNRVPLTPLEKRALEEKIFLMNIKKYFYQEQDNTICETPPPEYFIQWTLQEKYHWVENFSANGTIGKYNHRLFWCISYLKAYTVITLAKCLTKTPNNSQNISIIWEITHQLFDNMAFEVRNEALLSLLKALPSEQQLSYTDLLDQLMQSSLFRDRCRQTATRLGQATLEQNYEHYNRLLKNTIQTYIAAESFPQAQGDHGQFHLSGFIPPLHLQRIRAGEGMTLLSGHTYDTRTLAQLILSPELKPENEGTQHPLHQRDLHHLVLPWLAGEDSIAFLCSGDAVSASTLKHLRQGWIMQNARNPNTQIKMQDVEICAIADKILWLNLELHNPKIGIAFETPSIEEFQNWSIAHKYRWLKEFSAQNLNGVRFWCKSRLYAYTAAVLAKHIVTIPNDTTTDTIQYLQEEYSIFYQPMQTHPGVSFVWLITLKLMESLAFEERNIAIMSIIGAFTSNMQQEQLCYIDFVKELIKTGSLSLDDYSFFEENKSQCDKNYAQANQALTMAIESYITQHLSVVSQSSRQGKYTHAGYEAFSVPSNHRSSFFYRDDGLGQAFNHYFGAHSPSSRP